MHANHPAPIFHHGQLIVPVQIDDAKPGCTPRCKDGWIWVRHGDDVAPEPCDTCNPDGR